jgi:hypothetical protein
MNILYVAVDAPNEWNSSEWRCAIPARQIQKVPGHGAAVISEAAFADSVKEGSEVARAIIAANLIVYQRNIFKNEVWNAIRFWQGLGHPVVVDMDDHYLGLPIGNPAFVYWNTPNADLNNRTPLDVAKERMLLVDAVMSPNPLILRAWGDCGVKELYLVPNYADGARWESLEKKPHEGFWVGWGGSHSHYETWFRSGCAEGLRLACAERPDIKVVIWGADTRILDMIPVPAEQKIHAGMVMPSEIERWPKEMAQFDVALAPLGGTYDRHRSWIHALEPMLAKVPWVGSKGELWGQLTEWGTTVGEDPREWASAIIHMHDQYASYQEKAEDAYVQAVAYTMERKAPEYISGMERIVRRSGAKWNRVPVIRVS